MPKLVVVHHAHHPDEEVYRLIYAEAHTHTQHNPETQEYEEVTIHHNHQDIIWDARDPKWQDRSPEDVADEQLQIVRDTLTKQAAEKERMEAEQAERLKNTKHFDTLHQEL